MTNDELRALADAIVYRDSLAIARVADYLRACADAQPVAHCAMLDSHRRVVERAIEDAARPSGMSTHDGKAHIDASVLRRMLAIIDSLPAAPQAEPCIGNDSACPCQDGDACHYKDAADGTKAWPVPQAEPVSDPRPCTCHPDDNPPVPCAQKYALNECRAASEPTETEIKARDALLDFISENGTASEGVQHYLDRYVRAALAAKE